MTLLVSIQSWDPDPWLERFRRALPGRAVIDARAPFDRAAVRYAATWKHAPAGLAGLPNLQVIFSLGAGVDHVMGDPHLPDAPVVRVVDDDLTQRMGEWVALHVLRHHRQHDRYAAQQLKRIWIDDRHQPAARDVRVGVMGLGVLGQHAAGLLKAIGFDVAGWSRSPKTLAGLHSYSGAAGLDAFLARTDILVCLLPLTPETRGILNTTLFGKLAQGGRLGGPVLINAGRGGLQVEADIIRAIGEGVLIAATLDVFETEPLPEASPLWAMPQICITPHNSAMSDPDAIAAVIASQIAVFEAGGPLANVVDHRAGY